MHTHESSTQGVEKGSLSQAQYQSGGRMHKTEKEMSHDTEQISPFLNQGFIG